MIFLTLLKPFQMMDLGAKKEPVERLFDMLYNIKIE